jgi:DNA polymerase I-like protein with 3'-5' exonuclease and polymerase domains
MVTAVEAVPAVAAPSAPAVEMGDSMHFPVHGCRADMLACARAMRTFLCTLKDKGMQDLFFSLEMVLTPHLAAMHVCGMQVSTAALQQHTAVLKGRCAQLEAEAHRLAGREFLVTSVHQVCVCVCVCVRGD